MRTAMHASPRYSRAKIKRLIVVCIVIGFSGATWFAFNSTQRAPDGTFTLLSGQKISTAQLTGKVYLVNFWATSCATCIREMPQMVHTYNKFKSQGLEFIAVAMHYDSPLYVNHYSQTARLPFKVAIDYDGSAAKRFGNVQLTPTTFVIGKDGRILKRYVGVPKFSALDTLLKAALST